MIAANALQRTAVPDLGKCITQSVALGWKFVKALTRPRYPFSKRQTRNEVLYT